MIMMIVFLVTIDSIPSNDSICNTTDNSYDCCSFCILSKEIDILNFRKRCASGTQERISKAQGCVPLVIAFSTC